MLETNISAFSQRLEIVEFGLKLPDPRASVVMEAVLYKIPKDDSIPLLVTDVPDNLGYLCCHGNAGGWPKVTLF